MNKAELRREYLRRQKNLSPIDVAALSQQITQQLFDEFDFSALRMVHCFLPIPKNGEINTWLIVKQLWDNFSNVQVVVPRTNPATYTMTSHVLDAQTRLTETRWGVPEPAETHAIDASQIDCILLPLLAYDLQGYRVGYGKGFYDRFLAQCRPDVLKIGLSYHDPVAKIDDIDEFDVPLNYCVTPEKVWGFQPLSGL